MNNTFYFGVDPIDLNCVACLLVCKYTNQKKVDLFSNSDWSLIHSGKKYCILIGRFDATFFQSLTRLYCISALISWYATMNAWIQIRVQGEMCGNNTIKLEWHIYIQCINFPFKTVLVKKYTPCQRVVWSQYRLSGKFYVPIIFGVILFAKVCFFIPMQFFRKAVHFTLALLDLIFKLQYLMNYSSDFNDFCRFQ